MLWKFFRNTLIWNWEFSNQCIHIRASLVAQMVKNMPSMQETQGWSLDRECTMKKGMATHSSTLAWRIPWLEEPGRLQIMGSQRVRHNCVTFIFLWVLELVHLFHNQASSSPCVQGQVRHYSSCPQNRQHVHGTVLLVLAAFSLLEYDWLGPQRYVPLKGSLKNCDFIHCIYFRF